MRFLLFTGQRNRFISLGRVALSRWLQNEWKVTEMLQLLERASPGERSRVLGPGWPPRLPGCRVGLLGWHVLLLLRRLARFHLPRHICSCPLRGSTFTRIQLVLYTSKLRLFSVFSKFVFSCLKLFNICWMRSSLTNSDEQERRRELDRAIVKLWSRF